MPLAIAADEKFARALDGLDTKRTRIGWLGDLGGYLPIEAGILDVCGQGLARLRDIGCAVGEAALGYAPEKVWHAWLVWRRWLVAGLIAPLLANPQHRALIKAEALWEYEQAQGLSGADVLAASVERTSFYRHLLALFTQHDFLALPAAQAWPFDATLRWPARIAGREMDTYHRWMEVTIYATFAGLPCISVPVGFNADGLPMGMQLIGRPQADLAVLQLAHTYEQAAQDVLTVAPRV